MVSYLQLSSPDRTHVYYFVRVIDILNFRHYCDGNLFQSDEKQYWCETVKICYNHFL